MGKEPVAYRAASDAGSPIVCPKCGYAQEERPDCRKCGVVFSKYYALFPPGKSSGESAADEFAALVSPEQDRGAIITDLQLQVRELSARFTDVEFEKAERNQLRTDMRNLERQLERVEKRFEELPASRSEQEFAFHLPMLLERLEQIEGRLEHLDQLGSQISDLEAKNETNSQFMLELQSKYSILCEEVSAIKSRLELARQASAAEDPSSTTIEDDVRTIRKNLDEFLRLVGTAGKNQ